MNTNHNRIKVSDLETDEPDKILATNSNGELEFITTKNIKVDSYNALDYEQEGKALDARQGKILKDLVNNKTNKGGFQGTAQDLANSIPDLNSPNLKLGSYPSTRNDGQLSTNKVLSTDAGGNLKLYSLPISPTYPAPYLTEILPYIFLPNTNGNIILKGSFFTPNMKVVIQGQTINYLTFKSDNEVHVNVTTGSAEGSFSVTLNNGLSTTFPNALLIVLGTVFTPTEVEWVDVSVADVSEGSAVRLKTFASTCNAEWIKEFDRTKNWRLKLNPVRSPLGTLPPGQYQFQDLKLMTADGLTTIIKYQIYQHGSGLYHNVSSANNGWGYVSGSPIVKWDDVPMNPFELRYVGGVLYAYEGNSLGRTFTDVLTQNLKLVVTSTYYDFADIKYIETA